MDALVKIEGAALPLLFVLHCEVAFKFRNLQVAEKVVSGEKKYKPMSLIYRLHQVGAAHLSKHVLCYVTVILQPEWPT